ncbi:hypothetical protein ACFWBI_25435 [Streptomyces sp. NPDC059982]|uniref:hypothetical protein n=1 Tax=unclassified Streptomyces TaxID=2593676 RepID=UPI0036A86496
MGLKDQFQAKAKQLAERAETAETAETAERDERDEVSVRVAQAGPTAARPQGPQTVREAFDDGFGDGFDK